MLPVCLVSAGEPTEVSWLEQSRWSRPRLSLEEIGGRSHFVLHSQPCSIRWAMWEFPGRKQQTIECSQKQSSVWHANTRFSFLWLSYVLHRSTKKNTKSSGETAYHNRRKRIKCTTWEYLRRCFVSSVYKYALRIRAKILSHKHHHIPPITTDTHTYTKKQQKSYDQFRKGQEQDFKASDPTHEIQQIQV